MDFLVFQDFPDLVVKAGPLDAASSPGDENPFPEFLHYVVKFFLHYTPAENQPGRRLIIEIYHILCLLGLLLSSWNIIVILFYSSQWLFPVRREATANIGTRLCLLSFLPCLACTLCKDSNLHSIFDSRDITWLQSISSSRDIHLAGRMAFWIAVGHMGRPGEQKMMSPGRTNGLLGICRACCPAR